MSQREDFFYQAADNSTSISWSFIIVLQILILWWFFLIEWLLRFAFFCDGPLTSSFIYLHLFLRAETVSSFFPNEHLRHSTPCIGFNQFYHHLIFHTICFLHVNPKHINFKSCMVLFMLVLLHCRCYIDL